MSGESERVFVYGTLRLGASNHHRMKRAEWLRSGLVRGRLYQVSWYPGFVPDDDGREVVGGLYRVSPELLRELDAFEGIAAGGTVGEEYERRSIMVRRNPSEDVWDDLPDEVEAWVWVWRKPVRGLDEITSGDWLDVERPRQPSWFTAFGCLGLLAIPSGGTMLAGLAGSVGLGIGGDFLPCLLFLVAGGGGFWAGLMALRRRERGLPLQVLIFTGAVLWLVFALVLLSELAR